MKNPVDLSQNTILVTGSPGFVGAHLVLRLLKELPAGRILSLDNLNDYYDPALKKWRLARIEEAAKASPAEHIFLQGSIADREFMEEVFRKYRPGVVVNLAAQAGIRYSIDHPDEYMESNVVGFYNVLELCRRYPVQHLVYASSSSVYGANRKVPFATEDRTDDPVSFYGATKKTDELMARVYAGLYHIPCTGLRFFTVYGPAGRPDMFYYSAADKLVAGGTIQLYNYGKCERDFTYVDDIVEGIYRVMQGAPAETPDGSSQPTPPYAVYNIGGGHPVELLTFIRTLKDALVEAQVLPADFDLEAHMAYVPLPPADLVRTCADSAPLRQDYGFTPSVGIGEGLRAFARWYKEYRGA